jgi:hypothetical protein
MRAAACWLAAVLVVLLAPGGRASADDPPHALVRMDRVATALNEDPLFVDGDFAGILDGGERKQIRKAIDDASASFGMPVFVVMVPNTRESESQGYNDVFLHGLHEQLGKDGLYLMVDQDGELEGVPFKVPRELGYEVIPRALDTPVDRRKPFEGLASRIGQALALAAESPPGEPETPRLYMTADPFGQEDRPSSTDEPEFSDLFWLFFAGLLLVGPLVGPMLFGLFFAVRAVYRSWRHPVVPARPRMRRLRALADKELALLAELLPPPDDAPGRLVALRSYDAARLLSDDVGRGPAADDALAALDLVGVAVLARQGREVLEKGLDRPLVPCHANPLHGPGILKRQIIGMPQGKVCKECAALKTHERLHRVLQLPGGRRYNTLEGRWKRGFSDQNLASRVLESLGVE